MYYIIALCCKEMQFEYQSANQSQKAFSIILRKCCDCGKNVYGDYIKKKNQYPLTVQCWDLLSRAKIKAKNEPLI